MAFGYNALADWVAGLSITGVTVRSTSNIPEAVLPQQCPLLAPDPVGFVSDMSVERLTGRIGTARAYSVSYVATWILYAAPVAEGISLFTGYRALLTSLAAVHAAIMANETPTGAYDIRPYGTPSVGPMRDETGAGFHGARIQFLVNEFN
jgi:hypothetical protein